MKTIARLEVIAEEGTFHVIVRELADGGYRVFIDGGLLSDGSDAQQFTNVAAALAFAAGEASLALI